MEYFIDLDSLKHKEMGPGITLAAFNTEHLTVAYTTLKTGMEIPIHHHVHEAIDIIVDGELEMQVGEANGILSRGTISNVPSNTPHKAKAITDCKVITIFYPQREDLKS